MKKWALILCLILCGGLVMPDITKYLNPNHMDLFKSTDFELFIRGGAGAGKSYSVADKLILMGTFAHYPKTKTIVVRKTLTTIRKNVIPILEARCETFGVPFRLNQSKWTAQIGKMEILFISCKDSSAHQLVKGLTDVDFAWLNEGTELTELDYSIIKTRIRGGKASFRQIMLDFNPVGTHSWVYNYSHANADTARNVAKLKYTVYDNHPDYLKTENAQGFIKTLEDLKKQNLNMWKIYFLGEWGELEGLIYNWDTVSMDSIIGAEEYWYGLDFGFSVSKTALIRVWRKGADLYLQTVIHQTDIDNQMLIYKMRQIPEIANKPIYADEARPDSINEIYKAGFNVHPVPKGADSVINGINYMRGIPQVIDGQVVNPPYRIHILEDSPEIELEKSSYCFKQDKEGHPVPEPVKFQDDAMDASRYAIVGHLLKRQQGHIVIGGQVYTVG